MLKKCIEKLIHHQNLSAHEISAALEEILVSKNPEQVSAFLVLLRAKGETAEEFYALIKGMQAHMKTISTEAPVLDIVGTGGDQSNTVNISTASSILAAACGVRVLKHGNRSVSSQCGSADFIESLGVDIEASPEVVARCLESIGIAYAFAPVFHPAMKKVLPIRKSLGVRTIFNFLGPVLNPGNPQYYLLGVFSEAYMDLFADVLLRMPIKHAMVVHSCGLDELSLLGPSKIIEIKDGKKTYDTIDPESLGFQRCVLSDIQGGDAATNKRLLLKAMAGEPGPITDTIVLNAGVALYVADQVGGIQEGVASAREHVQMGAALKLIEKWVGFS